MGRGDTPSANSSRRFRPARPANEFGVLRCENLEQVALSAFDEDSFYSYPDQSMRALLHDAPPEVCLP